MSTLLELSSYKFHPQGVTALGLLSESHISIHTWPENGYAAVDVFTCGDAQPELSCRFLAEIFEAADYTLRVISRGFQSQSLRLTQFPEMQLQHAESA